MKNRLQYFYSITVFFGVFVTSYMMMSKRVPQSPGAVFQNQNFRNEARGLDPAVTQLIELQEALSSNPPQPSPANLPKRVPVSQ